MRMSTLALLGATLLLTSPAQARVPGCNAGPLRPVAILQGKNSRSPMAPARLTAAVTALRGNFDPGYLFYSFGKLTIMKLRDDWMILRPQNSLRTAHHTLLGYGTMPVRLVGGAMPGGAEHCRLLH